MTESEVYLQNYAALNAFFQSALQQLRVTMKTFPNERKLVIITIIP